MKSLLQFSEAPLQNVKVLDVEQVLQDPKWYGGGAKADQRTHIFESTACIVAMEGKSLTLSGLQSVMKDSEFDSIAKEFYTRFLNEKREFNGSDPAAVKALLDKKIYGKIPYDYPKKELSRLLNEAVNERNLFFQHRVENTKTKDLRTLWKELKYIFEKLHK